MLRKKYYTILSLLGISFTIMIITVFASFIDQVIGDNTAEPHRNKTLILDKLSIYNQGKSKEVQPSIFFLKQYVSNLQSTTAVSFITSKSFVSFTKGKATGHYLVYSDEKLWKITDFPFIAGRPFNKKELDKGARVAVINQKTKDYFFGTADALGKDVTVYGEKFKVLGVVKSGAAFSRVNADIFLPYTSDQNLKGNEQGLEGNYNALLLANTNDLTKVRTELRSRMKTLNRKISGADSVKVYAFTALEQFAKSTSNNDQEPEYGRTAISLFIVMLLFMLIPAISLINLNLSRIGERAEEIGIRKSFGATSGALVIQLLVENVIITLVGGLIGLGLSVYATQLLVQIINTFDPLFKMPADIFIINWRVLSFCIFSCLLFGMVSGIYPAWKMSKLNPVYALKGGQSL